MAMTPKEQLDIVSAYVAGEKIQYRPTFCGWDNKNVCGANYEFNFQQFEYRRLPKPLELWVNVYNDGHIGCAYHYHREAVENCGKGGRTVHMIEVQDD